MFDLGWQELMVIAVIAIIVISPKDLPHAIRTVTQFARQLRGLSREFRNGVQALVREAELDEIKRQVEQSKRFDVFDDPTAGDDPTSGLTADFDPRELARELKRRVSIEEPSSADAAARRAPADESPACEKPENRIRGGETAGDQGASISAQAKRTSGA